jgi:hypothetical protein
VCCIGRGLVGFSPGVHGLGHGHDMEGLGRAGRGVHCVARLVPCRFVCGAEEMGMCTSQNTSGVLGGQSMHGHEQGAVGVGSTGDKGGGWSLGVDGGASGRPVARLRPLACGRRLVFNGMRSVSVGE